MKYVSCTNWGKREIPSERQVKLPILYDGIHLEDGLRIDLLVNRKLILEIKASSKNGIERIIL